MDIERQNFLPEQKKEVYHDKWRNVPNNRKAINMDELEANLRGHLKVMKQELKQNGGVPPNSRLKEIDDFLGC
ncbi:MAG TPA: hypothetical protein VNX68_10405 [Nitrosopumilaceae archaeon]|jgi:hypothetical protein|nr:hypothetical protein [Nitrosopumilaceae archaeon]